MPRTDAVFRIVKGANGARVRPASDVCEKGAAGVIQTIKFVNRTADFAWVKLPGGVFAGQPNPFILELKVKPDPDHKKTLNVNATADGLFTFKVFCDETFDFAEGNSDPEFIIEN